MAYCTRCGRKIQPGEICACCADRTLPIDFTQFQGFIVSVKNKLGIGAPVKDADDCFERGRPIVPVSIEPAEGEIPIRQYDIAVIRARLRLLYAEGRLQVTSRRVVFRASGIGLAGKTTLQHEIRVEDVSAIEARITSKVNCINSSVAFLFLGLPLFFGFAAAQAALTFSKGIGAAIIIAAFATGLTQLFAYRRKLLYRLAPVGASLGALFAATCSFGFNIPFLVLFFLGCVFAAFAWLACSFTPCLALRVKAKSGSSSFDITVGFTSSASEALPAEQAEEAIREISAIIMDVQSLGAAAAEKWNA
jgi:hypothetical protein